MIAETMGCDEDKQWFAGGFVEVDPPSQAQNTSEPTPEMFYPLLSAVREYLPLAETRERIALAGRLLYERRRAANLLRGPLLQELRRREQHRSE